MEAQTKHTGVAPVSTTAASLEGQRHLKLMRAQRTFGPRLHDLVDIRHRALKGRPPRAIDDAQDDGRAVPLGALVKVVRLLNQVVDHLGAFGALHRLVVLFAHLDRQMLVDDLSDQAPSIRVRHREQVPTVRDELVGDVQSGSIRARGGSTV